MRRFVIGIGVGLLLGQAFWRTSYRFLARAMLREVERRLIAEGAWRGRTS